MHSAQLSTKCIASQAGVISVVQRTRAAQIHKAFSVNRLSGRNSPSHALPARPRMQLRAEATEQVAATAAPIKSSGISFEVTIKKPLGLVLVEGPAGTVVVEEVVEGGNASKSGAVQVGDTLEACSATILKAGKEGAYAKEGHGARPYDNFEKIMFEAEGQDFTTVMGAISSNNPRWGILNITMRFRRSA